MIVGCYLIKYICFRFFVCKIYLNTSLWDVFHVGVCVWGEVLPKQSIGVEFSERVKVQFVMVLL